MSWKSTKCVWKNIRKVNVRYDDIYLEFFFFTVFDLNK